MVTPTFNLTPTTTTTTTVITTVISAATTTAILCSLARDIIPETLQSYITSRVKNLSKTLSTQFTVVIEEFNGIAPNQMFEFANVYLGTKISSTTRRVKAVKSDKEREVSFVVDGDDEIVDFYDGGKFVWVMVAGVGSSCSKKKRKNDGGGNGLLKDEVRYFEVRFHKKYRGAVLLRYLQHVLSEAKKIKETKKEIKLHTIDYNGTDYWSCIILDHPATFDKIAMDPDAKKELIDDLELFISRKDYYRRVGKAWKRGYLLYGPPGTGKSSLVAAMASYLKFDVYDLDLKEVMCNSDLRRLLIGTASKSILVIEDIDCSIDLQNRTDGGAVTVDDAKVTLSGLLNFVDGLWSSCGDERIIVFTTNHKDRLDPALLRPGRMDVHIHMSYCTFSGFKLLANNYLGIQDHPLYNDIQNLLGHVEVTPAQIAGELMKRNDPTIALQGLVDFIQSLNKSPEIVN